MNMYHIAETEGSTLDEVIAALPEGEGSSDVINVLDVCDRDDLLQECLSRSAYKTEAEETIERRKIMEESRQQWNEKVANYPSVFREWNEVLSSPTVVGLYGVSYPSQTALRHDLGDNYVAIMNDGLWLYHFEIMSMEGEGLFRLCQHPTGCDDGGKPCGENIFSLNFRKLKKSEFGKIFTGKQILNHLKTLYQKNTANQ